MNETSSSYHRYFEKIGGETYIGTYEVRHSSNGRGLDPQFMVSDRDETTNDAIETILLNRHLDEAYKPKPDAVREVLLVNSLSAGPLLYAASPLECNCVLVFDGETNKLKGCTFKAT
jgi:hypothetical protein